ncbi:hypothetical protein ALC60_01669 [Trachymyrmex zeteki]|uniref:Uncharacterized protein n=1 Tax=Mycetomoellerius zeteki TaxID=64791 RepID=A0A151XG52_9HYME|nr:hypothetical protein ALC60_01669 [Trachymyrmex zeteki]
MPSLLERVLISCSMAEKRGAKFSTELHSYVKWYPMPNLFFKNRELPQHLSFPLLITAFLSASISASSMK